MALIFEIELVVVYWNSFFACGCAIDLCLCTVWMPNVFRVQEERSKIAVTFLHRAVGFRSASLWLVESKPFFFENHIWFWLLGHNYHEDERISEFGMQEKADPVAFWKSPCFTLNVLVMKPRKGSISQMNTLDSSGAIWPYLKVFFFAFVWFWSSCLR